MTMLCKAFFCSLFLLICDSSADFINDSRDHGLQQMLSKFQDGRQFSGKAKKGQDCVADIQQLQLQIAALTAQLDSLHQVLMDNVADVRRLEGDMDTLEGVQEKQGTQIADVTSDVNGLGKKMCWLSLPSVGGAAGIWFSDWQQFAASGYAKISKIVIHSQSLVDRICVTYGSVSAPCHGGNGGRQNIINLANDEYIREVQGRAKGMLDQIAFVTNKRKYGPYGGSGGIPFSIEVDGRALAFISGNSEGMVDRLQFYFNC